MGRGAFVDVCPDLRLPRYAAIDVTNDDRSTLDLSLRLVFDEHAAQYVVDTLIAHRRDGNTNVDGVALRKVPVQEYMREIEWAATIADTGEVMPNPLSAHIVEDVKRRGPSDLDGLRWVARVYAAAHAFRRAPARAVQEQLSMPTPTASVWIRRARDRGLLLGAGDEALHMDQEEFERAKRALRDG